MRWIDHHDRPGRKAGLLLALVIASGVAAAAPEMGPETAGRVPKPIIERGQGDRCVEDTDFMRRNHMKLLKHQRDETVHNGIRSKRYSLNGCIECHASRKTGSVIGSDQNFCQGCHSYAAVALDCFECHASKPGAKAALTGPGARENAPNRALAPVGQPAGGPLAGAASEASAR
jgi:hypothetical protein